MLWRKLSGAGGLVGGIEVVAAFVTNNGNTATPSIPLTGYGLQADDVIYTSISFKNGTDRNITCTSTGYTETHDAFANDTYDTQMASYYKVADGTETTLSFNIVVSGVARISVVIARGVDTSSPTDGYVAANKLTNGVALSQPDITTSYNNSLIILFGSASGGTVSTAPLTGFTAPTGTENFNQQGGFSHKHCVATYIAETSGSQATPDFGGGTTGDVRQSCICITVALKAA